MDVAEVKEALAQYDDGEAGTHQVSALAMAARRWVRAVETGQQMGWCDTHNQRANMVIEKPGCYHRLGCRVSQRLIIRP